MKKVLFIVLATTILGWVSPMKAEDAKGVEIKTYTYAIKGKDTLRVDVYLREQEHGNTYQHSDISSEPYNRLDISLVYQLQLKKIKIQAGASVLNVLNTNNVRYSYRLSDQDNVFNVYAKATPLTPIVFFEIIF